MGFLTEDFMDSVRRLDDLTQFPRTFLGTSTTVDCERITDDNGQRIYIRAPGYSRDDLNVEVRNGSLRVYGALSDDKRPTRLIPPEISYQFTVGGGYQIDEAIHRDGVLCIKLSRLDQAEGTKIPIS